MPKTKFLRTLLCSVACLSATLLCQAGVSAPDDLHAKLSRLITTQFEEPLIATSTTSSADDAALLAAVEQYQARTSDDDYHALNDFLNAHPKSGWNVALLTNLGLSYYRDGRFSQALKAWETAWRAGKDLTEPRAKALVDRAFGELMRMHARLGHVERLAALFKALGDRPVSGPATELVQGAREGLWVMRNEPGIAFLCGPMALKNLLLAQGATASQVEFLDKVRSGRQGVSLKEVDRLAKQAKLSHRLIHRDVGQPIPVPSIVHWKVSHYAAIVGEANGRYHLKDPTFGEELWVTRDAIDTESSGYFLVKRQSLEQGWRNVTLTEAGHVRGMGYTADSKNSATTPQDDKTKPDECPHGMCNYNITEMVVSLNLNDAPVGYAPPKGPPVFVKLTYNQREASQVSTFSWNVSQKWAVNWLSYIEDSPTVPGTNVIRYVAGGGSINYNGYDSTTGQFTPETRDQSVLVRTSSSPISYERRLPDGSREVYGKSNGATVAPRRIFLTQRIDPAGNAVTLNYDAQIRLTSITDATGRNTTFAYELSAQPLLLTRITDPFGRFALITYDPTGRLSSITDVLGLTSSFHYNASSLIDSMTTPYGTTSFASTESGNFRTLEITDPLGFKERVEYLRFAPIPFADPASTVPQGITNAYNVYLDGRNTFYWDKVAHQLGVGDYTKARIKHWVHLGIDGSFTNVTGDTVESIKYPLENRIWFSYPGQPTSGIGAAVSGSYDQPNRTGRVLDDGTTQLTLKDYNARGNVTRMVDALGRETTYEYATNLIDVLRVKQKSSATATTLLGSFTYNSQHLPLTATDAAGQTTTFTYNAAGQVTTVTNALNQKTTYVYAANGNLATVINANNKTALSYTYDSFNRIAMRTDSEGYAIAYTYDAFDRVTRETYPDTTQRDTAYNKLDRVSVTDRLGRTTLYTYDALRRLTQEKDPLLRVTAYGYFPNDQLKTLTDPKGNITTWGRDLQSREVTKTYADGSQRTTTYENTTSRVKSVRDALSQSKQYTYTKDDRLLNITYVNPVNPTPAVTFAYDPFFPRVTSMVDGMGATAYTYIPGGGLGALRLAQEDGPFQNDVIAYGYDPLGRMSIAARSAAALRVGATMPLGAPSPTAVTSVPSSSLIWGKPTNAPVKRRGWSAPPGAMIQMATTAA